MTYTLVLLRHGQSIWNLENRFTGWTDVPLTELGIQEARSAADRLRNAGLSFDQAFTSVLHRAVDSLSIIQEEMHLSSLLVVQTWTLNERHYGCLQGLNKAETARRLGHDRVMYWRRSYRGRPPALEWDDYRHPRFDPRYSFLPPEQLPCSESLQDTVERLLPFWHSSIVPAIRSGRRVLILAHGNSLRALIKYLEDIPEAEVPGIHVPTGTPMIYELGLDLRPIRRYDLVNST